MKTKVVYCYVFANIWFTCVVVVVEGDGFGGVGGGLGVEGVESSASVVVVNVDFMDGGGV